MQRNIHSELQTTSFDEALKQQMEAFFVFKTLHQKELKKKNPNLIGYKFESEKFLRSLLELFQQATFQLKTHLQESDHLNQANTKLLVDSLKQSTLFVNATIAAVESNKHTLDQKITNMQNTAFALKGSVDKLHEQLGKPMAQYHGSTLSMLLGAGAICMGIILGVAIPPVGVALVIVGLTMLIAGATAYFGSSFVHDDSATLKKVARNIEEKTQEATVEIINSFSLFKPATNSSKRIDTDKKPVLKIT